MTYGKCIRCEDEEVSLNLDGECSDCELYTDDEEAMDRDEEQEED